MALTPSTMAPLGMKAPPFSLQDTEAKTVSLGDFEKAPVLLVAFLCNHCPYVQHVRHAFARLGRDYLQRGVAIVGINSNDATTYPEDSPARMIEEKRKAGYTFPYLYDETQNVARAYTAACTPDFFVFDKDRKLAYRGQMDDSRPGNEKLNDGADLRAALDALLGGGTPSADQKPSVGCNIKWKSEK